MQFDGSTYEDKVTCVVFCLGFFFLKPPTPRLRQQTHMSDGNIQSTIFSEVMLMGRDTVLTDIFAYTHTYLFIYLNMLQYINLLNKHVFVCIFVYLYVFILCKNTEHSGECNKNGCFYTKILPDSQFSSPKPEK